MTLPGSSETIAMLGPYLKHRRYPHGRVLWKEGGTSGYLTVIDHGRVKILRSRTDGSPVLLYVFGPGDVFGFLPFLDGGPYPGTAIALDDVEARVMSRAGLLEAIEKDPPLLMGLFTALGRRLREAFGRIEQLSRRDALVRVAAALTALLPEETGGHAVQVLKIPGPIYGVAEEAGLQAETFSRAVTQLGEKGILHRLGPRKFQILNPEALRALAAGRPTSLSRRKNDPS